MTTIKYVALAGATGNLGSKVLDALLKSGDFVVTALKRVGSETTVPAPVKVVEVDYDSLDMLRLALEGQDAVICALGMGTDASVHNQLIDASIAANIKRFIPSEFAFDVKNSLARRLPIFENKLKVMEHLEEKIRKSRMTYTYIINSAFLDWGLQHNFILDLSQCNPTIFGSGDEPFSTTTMATAAKAVVGVLKHYEETSNRAVYIQDAVVSQNMLLAIVKKHTPGKAWEPVHVDLAEMKAESDAAMQKGTYDLSTLYSYLFVALFAEGFGGLLEPTDNELLGIKEMTRDEIEDLVKAYLSLN
ncbi:putative isoflavone reductase like protein P3 [Leptodontidium sp. 2 PMI_412]|nr:putative isoflavone reductase like protein P3 [Leptodontidium sp. 2 PMI_412]